MVSIPTEFETRVTQVHGDKGRLWLASLGETVAFCEHRWNIKVLSPFNLSFNYVAPVRFKDGSGGVLKLCVPGKACSTEIVTLKSYGGVSMCRLIDSVEDRGAILIEKLNPGNHLKTVEYDTAAVKIAAMLMKKMRVKSPKTDNFQSVSDLAQGISKMRNHFGGGTGPFSEAVFREVEHQFPKLIGSETNTYLLHGDFHQENILLHNGEWKLIDPKGIIGEVEYEMIPFIINNLPDNQFEGLIDSRIFIFHKELDVDIQRVYRWALCHSLLSSLWNIEDHFGVTARDLALIHHLYSRLR